MSHPWIHRRVPYTFIEQFFTSEMHPQVYFRLKFRHGRIDEEAEVAGDEEILLRRLLM